MSSESPTGRACTTQAPTFGDAEDAIRSVHDVVGRKWQPILVYYLCREGPLGFSALKERVDDISSKMLSESLEDLEAGGLVDRKLLSDKPVRVEYSLTSRGQALEPVITEMVRWGTDHGDADEDATPERPLAAADGPGGGQ